LGGKVSVMRVSLAGWMICARKSIPRRRPARAAHATIAGSFTDQSVQSTAPMAIKATIYKADLSIADMDRNYYQEHSLTIARHPSETDERVMIRVLAYALHADPALAFTKDLFDVDEPALWLKDLTGAIDLWIEVGQPDEKRLLKAAGRAEKVIVYSYSATSSIWFKGIANKIERAKNVSVINIPAEISAQLEKMASRSMALQCTIQDGQVWLTDGTDTVLVEREALRGAV
jgi:uncharacterized protein YaeQ